jgi:hypothetical protein
MVSPSVSSVGDAAKESSSSFVASRSTSTPVGGMMEYPGSVEEAAALLGATITRYSCGGVQLQKREAVLPPQGMHPAFAVVSNNNSSSRGGSESELLQRLYMLRSMLRTVADSNEQLPTAPSILQVLKKLLGISTQMAAAASSAATTNTSSAAATISNNHITVQSDTSTTTTSISSNGEPQEQRAPRRMILLKHKYDTPPLWSTPCRSLWVDCVVLCYSLSTGTGSGDVTLFVRQMLVLASIHPRSAKAGGGVRVAALEVIAALLEHDDVVSPLISMQMATTNPALSSVPSRNFTLAVKLAPWSLDILQVCLKALRSAGNGEPTFREAAIHAACATATACRNAALKNRQSRSESTNTGEDEKDALVLLGAMEDKAIAESMKVLKQAVTDKFPEIRSAAATFAIILAPILIPHTGAATAASGADPLASLEEVLQLALRNLDDESSVVADGWAEATARCLCTAIHYSDVVKMASQSNIRNTGGGDGGISAESSTSPTTAPSPTNATTARFGSRKHSGLVHTLTSIKKAMNYIIEQFVKAGGELGASKAGGTFSVGGRAVRLGLSRSLSRLLRIQSSLSAIGESRSISMQTTIINVLEMVGAESDEQMKTSTLRTWSIADSTLSRLFTSRVLRHGLCEIASETTQLMILHELISLLPLTGREELPPSRPYPLNASQIQVVIIEISNIVIALGEATGSRVDETLTKIQVCLSNRNHGTRYEAAVACVAIATKFPSHGLDLVNVSLEVIQQELATIAGTITTGLDKNQEPQQQSLAMFRRSTKESSTVSDTTALCEFAIHGRALLISMVVKVMPTLSGGLPKETLASVLRAAEMLVFSQYNEVLTSSNSAAVCTCVRAGFEMISGVLTTGPDALEPYLSQIVSTWKKAGKAAIEGGKSMSPVHDLSCVESALTSVTVFLKHCSELLLIIPEALSQVSLLLEGVFPLLQAGGRLGSISNDPVAALMLESATAALLEAFAWLPSGSFPLVADEVFSFAAGQIRQSVERNIACSVLDSLVAKEDSILDSKPFCRAIKEDQLGGARDFEESIILLSGEVAQYTERESVLHLQSDAQRQNFGKNPSKLFLGSAILDLFMSDTEVHKPPTPLHEVGTWRRPLDPSCASKVRIIDAAIQAFSATFGLKDGKEQQGAMNMLESLVPPALSQFARAIGINAVSAEQEKRSKVGPRFILV